MKPSKFLVLSVVFLWISICLPAQSAYDLDLSNDISYIHDLGQGFPIIGKKMDDVTFEDGKATFLFIGACGDLNTNRQAKRVVNLYRKYRDENIKFVIIDVDHPTNVAAKNIISRYYQGYIPYEALFDKQGKLVWSNSGEVDSHLLNSKINKALQ